MGAGVLFGLTENTADVVLKWTLGVEFDSANVAADLGTWVHEAG